VWSWIVSVVLGPLFGALANWAEAQQARIDEQKLGQSQQAVVDANAQTAQANAATVAVAGVGAAERASLGHSIADPASVRDPSPFSRD
jgi:hypothetical protein